MLMAPAQAVTIEGEIIKICGVSGQTMANGKGGKVLTVCAGGRGMNIAAINHPKGSAVLGNVIAAHHNNLKDLLLAITAALGPNLDNIVKGASSDVAPPPCTASYRLTFWLRRGTAGITDDLQMCAKDAQENYAWHSVLGQ